MVQGEQSRFVRKTKGAKLNHVILIKHPVKKMFWEIFSFKSTGSLFPVKEMMNANKYIEVIQRKVVRDMEKAFS